MQIPMLNNNNNNNKKKGKYIEDPIKNLPQLPEKRAKTTWNDPQNFNQFSVGLKDNELGQNSFDLIKEINSSNPNFFCIYIYLSKTKFYFLLKTEDPKKYKLLGEIRTKKHVKINSAESALRNAENVKRNREEFRRSLVDIIM